MEAEIIAILVDSEVLGIDGLDKEAIFEEQEGIYQQIHAMILGLTN